MKTNLRRKFFYWLAEVVFRVPHGELLPKPLRVLGWILFPYESLMLRSRVTNYNFETAVFTIYGMKYSAQLFKDWAEGGIPLGKYFTIVKRENGNIAIKDFTPMSDAELVARARQLKSENKIVYMSDFLHGYDYALEQLQSNQPHTAKE